jgi:DNA-binding NarL/FixJ family response regulator
MSDQGRLVLLFEPDPWRRESLAAFLVGARHQVETEERAGLRPEIVLVNLSDRPAEGRSRIERLRRDYPDAKIVAFVREVDSSTVFPCLLLGVKGILPFDAIAREIQAAFACVLSGSIWSPRSVLAQWVDRMATLGVGEATGWAFTRSEQRVLDGLHEDLSNKDIARRLGVTEATVKFHITKLLKKTGTRGRRELSRFVMETVPSGKSGLDPGVASTRPRS